MATNPKALVISIDPVTLGTKGNCGGLAYWVDGLLTLAGHFRTLDELSVLDHRATPVVELPEVYTLERSKGDPRQLVRLAFDAGRIVEHVSAKHQPVTPYPKQWKGNMQKQIVERRVMQHLCHEGEQEALGQALSNCRKSWHHNIIEAVGIGLWYLRRWPV